MKGKGGRPRFTPTAEQQKMVETLVGFGVPEDEIRSVIPNPASDKPIALMTLRAAFKPELMRGRTRANAKVAGFLFEKASGQKGADNAAVVAAIFWLKCRAHWKPEKDAYPSNEEVGKKEQASRDAASAGVGTDWGDDLMPANVVAITPR